MTTEAMVREAPLSARGASDEMRGEFELNPDRFYPSRPWQEVMQLITGS